MEQSNSVIEALFFKCYYSYLRGILEDTQIFYALLKEEFNRNKISNPLHYNYLRELAKVKSALDGGSVSSKEWLEGLTPSIKKSNQNISQKELVRRIFEEGGNDLKKILGARETFLLTNTEHPCEPYGFVDMYYQDGETAFPIEIKTAEGDHRLLGQILKYDLYCRLHLHEKFYTRVQPVTICGSYDSLTISELKRNGILPILYKAEKNLRLSLI